MAEIAARLTDKPLYIRGFWSDETLNFDANGDLATPSKRTAFTLNGFSFRSLKLKNGVLTLSGKAIGVGFFKDATRRVELPGRERTIEIAAPANGDFGPALNTIFADGLEALAPSLPAYWQPWARKVYPAAYSAEANPSGTRDPENSSDCSASGSAHLMKVGGSVSAPRISRRVTALYSGAAKDLQVGGSAVVSLIVEADGHPTHIVVVTPLGLGLDEMALAAVERYQFVPAMQAGTPVRVVINIEVNFDIN